MQRFRKTLCKLAVLHRLNPNLQGSRLFDCKSCTNNKNDQFFEKKTSSGPKNVEKKKVFWGFPTLLQQKNFVLLRLSSNLQGSRLFNCKRCANLLYFWPKNLLRLSSNLQGSRLFDCKISAKKKMATFSKKK